MTEDTIFDAASLTKVVACTPAVMLLVERGQVKLDEPVQTYIPEFKGDGKEAITVRQLMLHISGLRGDIETKTDWHGQQTAIQKACAEKLTSPPGTAFRYSDINFFLLGEIVQRVTPYAAGGVRLARGLSALEDEGHRLPAAQVQAEAHRPDRGGERQALSRRRARPDRAAHGRRGRARGPVLHRVGPRAAMPACCSTRARWMACASSSPRPCG